MEKLGITKDDLVYILIDGLLEFDREDMNELQSKRPSTQIARDLSMLSRHFESPYIIVAMTALSWIPFLHDSLQYIPIIELIPPMLDASKVLPEDLQDNSENLILKTFLSFIGGHGRPLSIFLENFKNSHTSLSLQQRLEFSFKNTLLKFSNLYPKPLKDIDNWLPKVLNLIFSKKSVKGDTEIPNSNLKINDLIRTGLFHLKNMTDSYSYLNTTFLVLKFLESYSNILKNLMSINEINFDKQDKPAPLYRSKSQDPFNFEAFNGEFQMLKSCVFDTNTISAHTFLSGAMLSADCANLEFVINKLCLGKSEYRINTINLQKNSPKQKITKNPTLLKKNKRKSQSKEETMNSGDILVKVKDFHEISVKNIYEDHLIIINGYNMLQLQI